MAATFVSIRGLPNKSLRLGGGFGVGVAIGIGIDPDADTDSDPDMIPPQKGADG
jgi:hypothetical protein